MAATTTSPAASSFAFASLHPDDATHHPAPHALSADCDCYACRWRSRDRSVAYPAFPDLTRPPFAPGAPDFRFRCSPGLLLGQLAEWNHMDPRTGLPSDRGGDDPFPRWHSDPALRARVLARFLQDPRPPTALERKAYVRPLNLVDLDVLWKEELNPNEPANEHVDPMLVDPRGDPTDVDDQPQLLTQKFIDFDILDGASTAHSFRMQFNGGCGDGNTGWYATIRDRTTCFLVGIVTSTESDSSTVVTCLDDNLMARFVEHPDLPPVDLLLPVFRPDIGEYGTTWTCDANDLNLDVCSCQDPNPLLDPFRHLILSTGTIASSYAHQLELFFAIAARIKPNSFETRLDTPAAVAADFAEEFLVAAMGTKLLPRELLRMVARWCPAPAIYWAHFDT
ncbi:hypothetical protein HKX48_006643 [Thoreauomyces humboldtii]|nr:hypothetical protein HKX48_006643 [Thoreauomyces humboldtii]